MVNKKDNFHEYEEFNFIQYVNVLLKRRRMIVFGVLFCVIFAGTYSIIYSKRPSPVYIASARFLPSLISLAEKSETFEDKVISEYYRELLKGSLFLERIANRKFFIEKLGKEVDLASYYRVEADNETEKLTRATRTIRGNLKVSIHGPSKVISISYSTGKPELSLAIVNAFLEELIKYIQDITGSKLKQDRMFIENQLEQIRKLLKKAEAELADFTKKNKKIVTSDLEIEHEQLKRNVKVQEEVYITLKKQLELAKIAEQVKKSVIEIIERPATSLVRSSPKTKRLVILSAIVSLFLFIGLAFILEYISKIDPEEERYKEFYKYINDIKKDFKIIGRGKKSS